MASSKYNAEIKKITFERNSLQTIYFSFIRPVMEYADVVWDKYEANELEKIQKEAARIVNVATKLMSVDSLIPETGWETLAERRNKHNLLFLLNKIKNMSSVPNISCSTFNWNELTILLMKRNNIQTILLNSKL